MPFNKTDTAVNVYKCLWDTPILWGILQCIKRSPVTKYRHVRFNLLLKMCHYPETIYCIWNNECPFDLSLTFRVVICQFPHTTNNNKNMSDILHYSLQRAMSFAFLNRNLSCNIINLFIHIAQMNTLIIIIIVIIIIIIIIIITTTTIIL